MVAYSNHRRHRYKRRTFNGSKYTLYSSSGRRQPINTITNLVTLCHHRHLSASLCSSLRNQYRCLHPSLRIGSPCRINLHHKIIRVMICIINPRQVFTQNRCNKDLSPPLLQCILHKLCLNRTILVLLLFQHLRCCSNINSSSSFLSHIRRSNTQFILLRSNISIRYRRATDRLPSNLRT